MSLSCGIKHPGIGRRTPHHMRPSGPLYFASFENYPNGGKTQCQLHPSIAPVLRDLKNSRPLFANAQTVGKKKKFFPTNLTKNIFAWLAIKKLILPNAARKLLSDDTSIIAMERQQ